MSVSTLSPRFPLSSQSKQRVIHFRKCAERLLSNILIIRLEKTNNFLWFKAALSCVLYINMDRTTMFNVKVKVADKATKIYHPTLCSPYYLSVYCFGCIAHNSTGFVSLSSVSLPITEVNCLKPPFTATFDVLCLKCYRYNSLLSWKFYLWLLRVTESRQLVRGFVLWSINRLESFRLKEGQNVFACLLCLF